MCLPTGDRLAAHTFYTALGFEAVGEQGDDGLPEPLQFEVTPGLRVMLIPTGGFGWVIGDRKRSPRGRHECLVVIGLGTDAEVAEPDAMCTRCGRRDRVRGRDPDLGRPTQPRTPVRSPIPTATCGRSAGQTVS